MAAHRAERECFQHGHPAIGQRVGGEVAGGRGRELGRQLDGEAHTGLGRLRRQLQRAHHATDADGGVDVGEPERELFLLLGDQRLLEANRQVARGLVASDHWVFRRGDDAAQIAKIELFDVGDGRIGPVEPFGDAQLGQQLLGDGQQAGRRDLVLDLGAQASVLLVDGLAHGRDATLQRTLGDGLLLLGQIGQHRSAVRAAGRIVVWQLAAAEVSTAMIKSLTAAVRRSNLWGRLSAAWDCRSR